MKLSVVVPCFNEEKNIPLIIERFDKIKNSDVELILVDNGSSDGSYKLIKTLIKKYPYIKLVHVKKNIGYGFGIWSGLKKAKGEYLCWTHADMQTDLGDTIKAFKLIQKQPDPEKCFVKGYRKGRNLFDSFFTFGMSVFETLVLQSYLNDINAQPNLFHKSFINNIGEPPKDFSFDLFFYYKARKLNYKIIKFPVVFKSRIHGESHWNTSLSSKWKFIKRTIDFTFKLRKKI